MTKRKPTLIERDFQAVAQSLREEFRVLAELQELTNGKAPPDTARYLAEMQKQCIDLGERLSKLEKGLSPYTVAVVGDFGAGKSSFINHLLNDASACPVCAEPSTSALTMFVHGQVERIFSHSGGDQEEREEINRKEYAARVIQNPEKHPLGKKRPASRFTFEMPKPVLLGLRLLDTPGFNDPSNESHSEVTEGILSEVDALLYLLDIQKGEISGSEVAKLETIQSQFPEMKLVLVLTKADLKSPAAASKIKSSISSKYEKYFESRIITISTREERPDIDCLQIVESTIKELKTNAKTVQNASINQLIQNHFDRRLRDGTSALTILEGMSNDRKRVSRDRGEKRDRRLSQFIENGATVRSSFWSELSASFEKSLKVEEVPGSGFLGLFPDYKVTCRMERIGVGGSALSNELHEEAESLFQALLARPFSWSTEFLDGLPDRCAKAAQEMAGNMYCLHAVYENKELAQDGLRRELERTLPLIEEAAWAPVQECRDKIVHMIMELRSEDDEARKPAVEKFAQAVRSLQTIYRSQPSFITK